MSAEQFNRYKAGYLDKWQKLEFRPGWEEAAGKVAHGIISDKPAYVAIQAKTGVPWFFVGILHHLESGRNFTKHLHNGDSLQKRTYHVPKNRPPGQPPFTFEASCIDALQLKGLHRISEWTVARLCYEAERYNGFGYRRASIAIPSPYLWSGSYYYNRGKFVEDSQYDRNERSRQVGVMLILKKLNEFDSSTTLPLDIGEDVDADHAPVTEPASPSDEFRKATDPPLHEVSRKVGILQRIRDWLAGLGLSTAGLSVADVTGTGGSNVKLALEFIKSHAVFGVILGCLAGAALAALVLRYVREDHESGRYVPSGDHAEGE